MLITIREQDNTNGSNAVLSFDNADEFPIAVSDPFTPQQERLLEWYYETHLRFPFMDKVKALHAAASVAEYGERLFAQVFADPQALARYLAARQTGLERVCIEIVGSPPFHRYHWEALRDPELKRPLALEINLVRRTPSRQVIPATPQTSPTLNLLVVTARPGLDRDVGYRTITRPLVETLHNAQVRTQIDIVRPGSYRALKDHLETVRQEHGAGYYHVIHFDVHGALLTYEQFKRGGEADRFLFHSRYGRGEIAPYEGEKAFLFLADVAADVGKEAGDRSDPVVAQELVDLLLTHQIPIAILNACQSGKQVGASETSLGSRLVQAGMQMVVAMSYSVTVSAAERLIKTLYAQLLDGTELAVALRRAREDLHADKARRAYYGQHIDLEDWLLPVLYRNRDLKLPLRDFTRDEQTVYYERQAARYTRQELTTYRQPSYGFFGRDLDILHIETRLLCRNNLLLVRGMGGAGKTTLLHHLGDWWQTTHLVDRVCYFGYDAQAWTLPQILHGIARQVFPDEYDYDTKFKPLANEARQQQLLVEKLRSERHLLILDNLESITGNPMAIRNTLQEGEQTKLRRFLAELADGRSLVLLGSRSGEAWLAQGTFAENVYELEGLDPEAASQLAETILQRQGTTRYRKEPDFAEILKLLRGYPLALEVVLSNLTRQTPGEALASLRAGSVDLDRGDSQEKTESILRCIDYSHSNLSVEVQDLLLCLAPFTSVVYTPALEQYSEQLRQQPVLAGLPYDRWPEVLKEATEWGLLSPSKVGGYLELQPTLPYFLRSRLNVPEQHERREAIETAFRQHYNGLASSICQLLVSKATQEKQLGQTVAQLEYENLMTALDLALTTHVPLLELYRAISGYLNMTHDEGRGLQLGQKVLARLEGYSTEALSGPLGLELAGVVDDIARRQLLLMRYAEAEASYNRALSLLLANEGLSPEQRSRMSAGIYHQLGRVAEEQRIWEQAEGYFQQALQIYIELNDRHSQADTYHNLGIVFQGQHQWEQAKKYYGQALAVFIESDDRDKQASTYYQLGLVAQNQYQWEQAEKYYRQALVVYIESNDRYYQASCYHQLGRVAQGKREWRQAAECYRQALAIYIEFNDRYSQAGIYHNLGVVAQEQRQMDEADGYFQQALTIFSEFNDRYWQAGTYHQMGIMGLLRSQWDEAGQYLLQALEIYRQFKDVSRLGITLRSLARLWSESSDAGLPGVVATTLGMEASEVEETFRNLLEQNASTVHTELNSVDGMQENDVGDQIDLTLLNAFALLDEGRSLLDRGNWQQGLERLREALDLFRRTNDSRGRAETFLAIGDAHLRFGDYDSSRMYYKDAQRYFRQLNDSDGEALTLLKIGTVEFQLHETEDAVTKLTAASEYFHAHGDSQQAQTSDRILELIGQQATLL